MSKYTKDEPFMLSHGYKVGRKLDDICTQSPPHEWHHHERTHAEAIAEMLEAERHPDTWTVQEDGTWRKGRWVAKGDNKDAMCWHEDFPKCKFRHVTSGNFLASLSNIALESRMQALLGEQMQDFLAHLAATEWKPLPVPEVGTWGRFTLRNGTEITGRVVKTQSVEPVATRVVVEDAYQNPASVYIPRRANSHHWLDIIAWNPIDPPQPPEPTGLGAVVEVEGELYLNDHKHPACWWRSEDCPRTWRELTSRGPVTVRSPGVES